MILCHRYRFIFIKTRKTAGSSVEIGLSRACGPGDVVTPLSVQRGEEELRRREGGYGPEVPRKHLFEHRGVKEWRRLLLRGQRAPRFEAHSTAAEISRKTDPDTWRTYYRFTIERNPWDHAVSRYWWQKQRWEEKGRTGFPSVSEYLAYLERHKPHWLSNWGHYAIGDRVAVDRVLFYETLSTDVESVRNHLRIREAIALPEKRAKAGFRPDRASYRELLSDKDRDRIARICAREIEAFGYEF